MKLRKCPTPLAICRFDRSSEIPQWVATSRFFSVTKTSDELSIVCDQSVVPEGIQTERDWLSFRVVGTLDFSLTGILAAIAKPLAEEKVSIFSISTFDTDYVLVKSGDWPKACDALRAAGFTVIE